MGEEIRVTDRTGLVGNPKGRAPVKVYVYLGGKVGRVRFHPVAGHTGTERESRGIALLFHDLGTRWGWVVNVTSRPPLPPEKTQYPLYRRLGGLQGRSGKVRKILPPPGFDPRNFQPVASRYTDWAIPVNVFGRIALKWISRLYHRKFVLESSGLG